MKTSIDISEARELPHMAKLLKTDHVICVKRYGKPLLALVDLEYLSTLLETVKLISDPAALKLFQERLDEIRL